MSDVQRGTRMERLMQARAGAGPIVCLAVAFFALLGLPALHLLVHQHEARTPVVAAALLGDHAAAHGHVHAAAGTSPADNTGGHHRHPGDRGGGHGQGAPEHFGLALHVTPPLLFTPPALPLAALCPLPLREADPAPPLRRAHLPRGPPVI